MGCDLPNLPLCKLECRVSIHAPTWGATQTISSVYDKLGFQSTHPRGVRPITNATMLQSMQFQSTHPRGVRLLVLTRIHSQLKFQSTHPRGVRPGYQYSAASLYPFQSTHPRGVRRDRYRPFRRYHLRFNPRTHVGCDNLQTQIK